jgi:hypothetical protein
MLTTDKQRDEYIKIYEATDKATADRLIRGGDSITHCSTALSAVLANIDSKIALHDHSVIVEYDL